MPTIVLDNGSSILRAGFSGDNEAILAQLSRGVVTDWDTMERTWASAFTTLGANPEQHPVLVSDAPLNTRSNRENICQHMFEIFNVPALHISIGGLLALYASGRGSGIVIDSGEGVTHVLPVYEGQMFPHAIRRGNVAGTDITDYMLRLLAERGYILSSSADRQAIRETKEKMCSVAPASLDREQAKESNLRASSFILPDGKEIQVESDFFRRPAEALFDSSLIGQGNDGLQSVVWDSISKCDMDVRRTLVGNIILSGGNTCFPGLETRLTNEIKPLVPASSKVKVVAAQDRINFVWLGGSIFGELSLFPKNCVSSSEYDEIGPQVVYRKWIYV